MAYERTSNPTCDTTNSVPPRIEGQVCDQRAAQIIAASWLAWFACLRFAVSVQVCALMSGCDVIFQQVWAAVRENIIQLMEGDEANWEFDGGLVGIAPCAPLDDWEWAPGFHTGNACSEVVLCPGRFVPEDLVEKIEAHRQTMGCEALRPSLRDPASPGRRLRVRWPEEVVEEEQHIPSIGRGRRSRRGTSSSRAAVKEGLPQQFVEAAMAMEERAPASQLLETSAVPRPCGSLASNLMLHTAIKVRTLSDDCVNSPVA